MECFHLHNSSLSLLVCSENINMSMALNISFTEVMNLDSTSIITRQVHPDKPVQKWSVCSFNLVCLITWDCVEKSVHIFFSKGHRFLSLVMTTWYTLKCIPSFHASKLSKWAACRQIDLSSPIAGTNCLSCNCNSQRLGTLTPLSPFVIGAFTDVIWDSSMETVSFTCLTYW